MEPSTASCAWPWSAAAKARSSAASTPRPPCSTTAPRLVAGALSSDPAKAKASAPDYDIPAATGPTARIDELIEKEKALPADQRIDFVSVATPNHTHFEIAKAAVEAGFNVICDKPMTFDLAQAEELAAVVDRSGVVFAVSHNYTGYPLVRQAREMVLAGELGEINAIRSNLHPRLAPRTLDSSRTSRSKPPGAPIRRRAAPPAASATSARTPTTWPAT